MGHVLILPSWYPASRDDVQGVFFRDQAIALSEFGHRIGVIAIKTRSFSTMGSATKKVDGPAFECDQGMPTYRRCMLTALPQVPYLKYWIWRRGANILLKRYVKCHGWPDVIHAHSLLYAGAVAAEWRMRYGIPVVLTEHSSGFAGDLYAAWQWKLAGKGAQKVDARIAVSPTLGELLRDRLPTGGLAWEWVPNVVSSRFNRARRRTPNEGRPVRILNLALMTETKGQGDLLEAFRLGFGTGSDVELWFGGDGPLLTKLDALAHQFGVNDRVRFLGRIAPEEVPHLLGQVDIMVVASHYETFGLVAAEALMAGVPVVATRCGGSECIVGPGDGILVRPQCPEELADALVKQVDGLSSLDRSSIATRARKRFSSEAVAAQIDAVYQRVLRIAGSEVRP